MRNWRIEPTKEEQADSVIIKMLQSDAEELK